MAKKRLIVKSSFKLAMPARYLTKDINEIQIETEFKFLGENRSGHLKEFLADRRGRVFGKYGKKLDDTSQIVHYYLDQKEGFTTGINSQIVNLLKQRGISVSWQYKKFYLLENNKRVIDCDLSDFQDFIRHHYVLLSQKQVIAKNLIK